MKYLGALRGLFALSVATVAFLHGRAFADEPPAPPPAPPEEAPPPGNEPPPPADDLPKKKHKKKHKQADDSAVSAPAVAPAEIPKKKKAKKKPKVEFSARLLARSSLIDAETAADPVLQESLQSARAKAEYKAHELRAEIEMELANKTKIKNAYAQVRIAGGAAKVDIRAGNFKMPFSAIQLGSIWTLPLADRGLIDNVLVDRLQVAGRAPGAMVIAELGGAWKPELRAGVFQGSDDAGNLLAAPSADGFGQDAVFRATVQPTHGLQISMNGSVRSGELLQTPPLAVRHGYAGGLDTTIETCAGPGRLRAWLEAMVGTSWLVGGTNPFHKLTRFHEARGIVAWRYGGVEHWARFFEIYGLAGEVDPDRTFDGDRVVELTAGITYGATDVWRVQAEAEAWRIGDAAPLGIARFAVAPSDTTTFLLQLGAKL